MSDTPNLTPETETPQPEVTPAEPKEPTPPAVDYEKKFAESTKENQLLRERLAAEERARQELTKEPTDSEYRAAFPEWDALGDSEKADKRRLYNAERTAQKAAQIAQELKDERERNTSIELALASHTALQGREQAFRQYALKPQYKNVPLEVLVDAFLGKNPEPPVPTPADKRPGLLSGTGGPKEAPKPKTLNPEELKNLRLSDPRAYQDYLKTHPIEDIEI
jgi:hypothetical protein